MISHGVFNLVSRVHLHYVVSSDLDLASAFLPAVLLLAIYVCPESPRWLIKKNRYAEAFTSFRRLRFTDLQAARDMYYVHVYVSFFSHTSIPRLTARLQPTGRRKPNHAWRNLYRQIHRTVHHSSCTTSHQSVLCCYASTTNVRN